MLSYREFGRYALGIAGGIGVAVAMFAFIASEDAKSSRLDSGPSVEEFRTLFIAKIDEDLANPENDIRKRIEKAHWTVKTTSARVTACTIYTVDGSNRAGKNYSNISEIDFVTTAFWDGWMQKGGYTEIRMVVDAKTGQLKSCAYVGGNAAFNAEEIDWFKVCEVVLPIVVSSLAGGG